MTREEYIQELEEIVNKLELVESSMPELVEYANNAIALALQAVCHALDMANVCEEVAV